LKSRKQKKPSLFFPFFPVSYTISLQKKEKQKSCNKTLPFPLCFGKEQQVNLLLPLYFSLAEKLQKDLCISIFTSAKTAKKSLTPFSIFVSWLAAAKERENLSFSQLSLCFGLQQKKGKEKLSSLSLFFSVCSVHGMKKKREGKKKAKQ
jgi:hypothetical protein